MLDRSNKQWEHFSEKGVVLLEPKQEEILHTPHRFAFFHGDVKNYGDLLEGQTVMNATYHGGMIEMDTENCMVVFADGAYPKYYEDIKKFPKKHQLAIYFDDETAVFCVNTNVWHYLYISERKMYGRLLYFIQQ